MAIESQDDKYKHGKYWLHGDSDEVISYLSGYHSAWTLWATSPIRQAWVRNYLSYYSPVVQPSSWDTSFIFSGVQGELTKYFTPKAKSLMKQLVSLITKQRLAFQAMAQTSGQDVIKDVSLANSLLDQIIQNERLDIKNEELVEQALIMGASFLKTCWRTDKGEPYTVHDNQIIYTGAVDISVLSVFDVYYDIDKPHWEDLDWVECVTIKNRWDLIAQHPDKEEELKRLPSLFEIRGPNYWFDKNKRNEDLVIIFECYAKKSPALPEGRMVFYGDETTVLHDGPNIYGTLPVEPMIPEKVMCTGFGYPKFTDIMASQEMMDVCLSSIATNNSQNAVQSVTVPRGSNINVQELNGMRLVSFTPQNAPGGGRPEPLQLTQSSPETFKFIDKLDYIMGDLSGIQPALRGQVEGGVKSGVAIATLTANAMEFINSISKTYNTCLEKTMIHAVNCYKNFAKLPQSLTVSGKNNQVYNRDFTGKDIHNINGVKIIVSSPLMQTIAGKIEIAEKLMQMPKDLWPSYVAILEGRPLSELFKGSLSQNDLIFSENQNMIEGKRVIALATDDHPLHILEHSALLNDPIIRNNGEKIDEILSHIEEHVRLQKDTDPFLMAMVRTGKAPEQPPQQNMPSGGPSPSDVLSMPTDQPANPAQDLLNRQG